MTTHIQKRTQLGDLVVAAFDEAALYSTDSQVVARLATLAVEHIVSRQARDLEEPTLLVPPRLLTPQSGVR